MRLDTTEKRAAYRQAMMPKDAQRDPRSNDHAEAFTYTSGGRLCARGYIGTAAHPTFHYHFKDETRREQYIAQFFDGAQAQRAAVQSRKAARTGYRHTLQAGDLVHTSWGYDQTNVSFYEVTRIVSDKSVAVRPVKARQEETGFMCGKVYPLRGEFCGEETMHRVREGNVVVNVEHGRYSGYPCGTEGCANSWYA